MNFIEKYGRLIDRIGAAFFVVLSWVFLVYDLLGFSVAFVLGSIAFILSDVIRAKYGYRLARENYVPDAIGLLIACMFFAIMSAVWFLGSVISLVLT